MPITRAYAQAAEPGNFFVAGKNAVINGDFLINQRNFTSNTADSSYNFDRWTQQNFGGTFTLTPQTFTPGAAPIATYEGRKYLQAITASQSASGHLAVVTQRIEDVTRYAGTTVTVSFFAKADTGTPKIGVELFQSFGTGGSPSAGVSAPGGTVTLSTSWARYSVTIAVPSISGKTLGTTANTSFLELNLWQSAGANYNTRASSIGIQNFTASYWGVQLEAGAVATPFTTATGTLAGELAACQRYYYLEASGDEKTLGGVGYYSSATEYSFAVRFPVQMRTTPTLDYVSGTDYYRAAAVGYSDPFNTLTILRATPVSTFIINATQVSGTSGDAKSTFTNNPASYVAFSAEL